MDWQEELMRKRKEREAALDAMPSGDEAFARFKRQDGTTDMDAVLTAPDQKLSRRFLETQGFNRGPRGMTKESPIRVKSAVSGELPTADPIVDAALESLKAGRQLQTPMDRKYPDGEDIRNGPVTGPVPEWTDELNPAEKEIRNEKDAELRQTRDNARLGFGPPMRQDELSRFPGPKKVDPRAVLARARGGASPMKMEPMDIEAQVPPGEGISMDEMTIEGRQPQAVAGRSNRPDSVMADMMKGATPGDPEMDLARKSRDRDMGLAALASGLTRGADIIQGTKSPDAGQAIRQSADQPIQDLQQNRALAKEKRGEAVATDERSFARSVLKRKQEMADAAEGRAAGEYEAKNARREPSSRESQAARSQAAGLYPKEWGQVPNHDSLSAADAETFFKEMEMRKGKGAGAGGGKPLTGGQKSKLIPQDTLNIYENLQKAQQAAEKIGGWGKTHVGGMRGMVAGATGGMFESKDQQDALQSLGAAASMALSARGGKAITKEEEKVILGRIAANPFDPRLSPEQIQRAFSIIEGYTRNNLRQSLVGASPQERTEMLDYLGLDENWVKNEPNTAVVRGGQDGGSIRVRKNGVIGTIPANKFNPEIHERVE